MGGGNLRSVVTGGGKVGLVTGGGGTFRSCFVRSACRTNVTLTKARMGSLHVNGYDVGRSFVHIRGKRICVCKVRVDPCRGNGVFGGSPLEVHGLLLRECRVGGVRTGLGRGNLALMPLGICFGSDLMGMRVKVTQNGGLCSGERSVTGGSREERTRHSFGIGGLC